MNRRKFISFSTVCVVCASMPLCAKVEGADGEAVDSWEIIASVQERLLPHSAHMPSSSEVNATGFLREAMESPFFDESDREFILRGARFFGEGFPSFLRLDSYGRDEMIKEALKDDFYDSWFSLLIYYGFEAMFGDPLYGGNTNERGWQAVGHFVPVPRAKFLYGAKS